MLSRIKRLLSLTDNSKDQVINDFIEAYSNAVVLYCGIEAVPIELEWIVVEAVVARFNRLGSEGLTKEDIDVIRLTYTEEILSPYLRYLNAYISKQPSESKRLKLM